MRMPPDTPTLVFWRLADKDEVPRGATAIINAAHKGGWEVRVGYSCGQWMQNDGSLKMYNPNKLTESEEDEESEVTEATAADLKPAFAEVILVAGKRGDQMFFAKWYRKLWTKPGREEGKYIFAGARMIPGVSGEIWTSKAKAARHPDSIGPATVGGLKNADTLKAYLKERADAICDSDDHPQ